MNRRARRANPLTPAEHRERSQIFAVLTGLGVLVSLLDARPRWDYSLTMLALAFVTFLLTRRMPIERSTFWGIVVLVAGGHVAREIFLDWSGLSAEWWQALGISLFAFCVPDALFTRKPP